MTTNSDVLHAEDNAVDRFAVAMKLKLAASRVQGRAAGMICPGARPSGCRRCWLTLSGKGTRWTWLISR